MANIPSNVTIARSTTWLLKIVGSSTHRLSLVTARSKTGMALYNDYPADSWWPVVVFDYDTLKRARLESFRKRH